MLELMGPYAKDSFYYGIEVTHNHVIASGLQS
jgi:hypothetical protein